MILACWWWALAAWWTADAITIALAEIGPALTVEAG